MSYVSGKGGKSAGEKKTLIQFGKNKHMFKAGLVGPN